MHKQQYSPPNSWSFAQVLLLISGLESNPGPVKYPCGICSKPCRWNQKAVACDECDQWTHAKCLGITNSMYNDLANSSVAWYCATCNQPNHSLVPSDSSQSHSPDTSILQAGTAHAQASTRTFSRLATFVNFSALF